LDRALGAISDFGAVRLVVSLGADTLADDPVGQFALTPDTFSLMADRIGRLGLPTLVVQEGGYDLTRVGSCVANFLSAL
jgi:acetoin utilization deacetylase AcuC-like enzyme